MKQYIAIVLAMLMIATPLSVFSGTASDVMPSAAPNAGGTGTALDPYIIQNVTELQDMNLNLNAHYALGNDIDATVTKTWNSGAGFVPVGTLATQYFGSFDGRNFNITGLFINRTTTDYVGLFGYASDKFSNVTFIDCNVSGGSNVGALMGCNYFPGNMVTNCHMTGKVSGIGSNVGGLMGYNRGTVSDCSVSGNVSGSIDYVGGIIGYDWSGTISDCHVTGNVTGNRYVGGLVGYMDDSTISNCFTRCNVSGSNINVGGLVGYIDGGTVSNCFTTGIITGNNDNTGGIVGYTINAATVSNCYATGKVSSSGNYVGGLVGRSNHLDNKVLNCYATGNVSGAIDVGGLVGYNSGTVANCSAFGKISGTGNYIGGLVGMSGMGDTIENCYSTGNVSGALNVGGLIGTENGNNVLNCFWDVNTSGRATSAGGSGVIGQTTAQMMTQATFTAATWDFASVWWMINGQTRPFLRMEWSANITNSHQLQMIAMDLTANYILENDIDLSDITEPAQMWGTNMTSGVGFSPVGNGISKFSGSMEGGYHNINGLYINKAGMNYLGLFGYLTASSIVSNITLLDLTVNGSSGIGGLAGLNEGTVNNCSVVGNVNGSANFIGGVVGRNDGMISNCQAIGNYSGDIYVGGLVGYNAPAATLSNCQATARVIGTGDSIGGLAGGNEGIILNGQASGDVNGPMYVGGLIGLNVATAIVESCQATGDIKVTGDYSGGLIGWNGGPVMNSTTDCLINSTGRYVGGLVGSNSGDLTNCTSYSEIEMAGLFSGGLVGENNPGTISHCKAYGPTNVTSWNYCGGLVGMNSGEIESSSAYGIVNAVAWAGGLVGWNFGGNVRNCSADVTLSGDTYVGGIVGYNELGEISTSYSTGTVTAISIECGGLVGINAAASTITNSYSRATVTANAQAGGLIGNNTGGGMVTNCYSTGSVTGNSDIGGLIGVNWSSTVSDCFWNLDTSGQAGSAGGTGKTTSDMMLQSTFNPPWDFTTIWGIYEANSYPFLRVFGAPAEPQADLEVTLDGNADPVMFGDVLMYHGTLTNHGPANAADVMVNITLPIEVTLLNTSAGMTVNGRYITGNPGVMASGDIQHVFINVTVNPFGGALTLLQLSCTAFATSSTSDPGVFPNSTTEITVVNRVPVPWSVPENNIIRLTTEDNVYTLPSIIWNAGDPDMDPIIVISNEPSDYGAALTILANGSFSYDPTVSVTLQRLHEGQSVNDTFNYTVSDGRGGTANATITMRVDGREGLPTAVNDTFTVLEDSGPNVLMGVLSNDIIDEEGDPITIIVASVPWQGIATITGGGTGLNFTPRENFFGTFTFNYGITDGHGTVYASINMTVTGVNDAPVIGTIVNDLTVLENESYSWNYTGDDLVDGDTVTWSLVSNAAWLSINSTTGVLSGIPPFHSAGNYSVNITLSDGNGGADWLQFTLTVLADTDGDGIPDSLDYDKDGDGVPDGIDAFPLDPNESVDTDGDGIGNNADTDDDGDGVPDTTDAFPLDKTESVDTDSDGLGDNSDPDIDGDGVPNAEDADPYDPAVGATEGAAGDNMMLYLIIIIIVVVVVIAAVIMLRPKGPKPEKAEPAPAPQQEQAPPQETEAAISRELPPPPES